MLTVVNILSRRSNVDCRADVHRFGEAQLVGPGIIRRICVHCSSVSIDLTSDDAAPEPGLFSERAGSQSTGE